MKKYLILLISIFFSVLTVSADNYVGMNYDYSITSYDIDIVVNEDNTFDVTESITADFNVLKHGIYRTIPLVNKVERLDGTKYTNRVKIANISVNSMYSTYRENGNLKIKIGDPNSTFKGSKDYIIKYTYKNGGDFSKDYDELYYNLIGNDWDTTISNVTFRIVMPKDFDINMLGFSSGVFGSVDNDLVTYSVYKNVITGSYNGILNSGESLTVRCQLEDGYFISNNEISFMTYVMFALPVLFLIISILLWNHYGRDDKVVPTVQFYPPDGLNSLDVGFLYKGNADNVDVVSLLVYLANKGYIKISENEEKKLFSKKKGFTITKVREYDGNDVNEKLFLDGLFKNNPISVTNDDLYNEFYITLRQILDSANSNVNKNKIFEKSASNKKVFVALMIIVTFILITFPPILSFSDIKSMFVALIFPSIGFSVMIGFLFNNARIIYVNGVPKNSHIYVRLFGLFWGLIFGGIPFFILLLPILLYDPVYLIYYIVGLICITGMIICFIYLPKRNSYGNDMLGKLMGFKNFLETAEKSRLEALVMSNPTYFYDILPYAYVLGVSNKWISKFEAISMQAPNWYDGYDSFDMNSFGLFMSHTMNCANSSMSSSPSSSSSGGGFSGGGSGGGGGGSW